MFQYSWHANRKICASLLFFRRTAVVTKEITSIRYDLIWSLKGNVKVKMSITENIVNQNFKWRRKPWFLIFQNLTHKSKHFTFHWTLWGSAVLFQNKAIIFYIWGLVQITSDSPTLVPNLVSGNSTEIPEIDNFTITTSFNTKPGNFKKYIFFTLYWSR